MRRGNLRRQAGYTWIVVLVLLFNAALLGALAAQRWSDQTRREREQELLRVGLAYASAIDSYRRNTPGQRPQNPLQLEELLADPRRITVVRHLRALYPDPMQPQRPWGLIRDDEGRIAGIYSQDTRPPFRMTPVSLGAVRLIAARQYTDWKFLPQQRSQP